MADVNGPDPSSEAEPQRKVLWRAAIVGCVATIVLLSTSIFLALSGDGSLSSIGSASSILMILGFVACLIMVIPSKTRRWAGGLLLGFCIGLGVALVIFAGVCVVLIAGDSSSF